MHVSNALTVPPRKLLSLMLVMVPVVSGIGGTSLTEPDERDGRIAQMPHDALGWSAVSPPRRMPPDSSASNGLNLPCAMRSHVSRRTIRVMSAPLGKSLMGGSGERTPHDFPVFDVVAVKHLKMQARWSVKTVERGREPADAFSGVLLVRLQQRLERRERTCRFVADRGPNAFSTLCHRHLLTRGRTGIENPLLGQSQTARLVLVTSPLANSGSRLVANAVAVPIAAGNRGDAA